MAVRRRSDRRRVHHDAGEQFSLLTRIALGVFLLGHFSPGDKIENCSAQFPAVC